MLLGIRAGHLWKDIPEIAADQRIECQSPHFTGRLVYINKLPFSIDSAETVADCLKDISCNTDKPLSLYGNTASMA
jgi:hypothetical protein